LYAQEKYDQGGTIGITGFDSNSLSFEMHWTTGCRGCYDEHEIDFNISFETLAAENWKEKLRAEIAEAKRKAEEKALKERIRYAKETSDREQLEYLRLKEKYER